MIKVTLKDTKLITDILTDSFITNKSIQNVTRNGINKKKRVRSLMKFFFLNAYHNGDVYLNNDKTACLLMLKGNSKVKLSLLTRAKFLLWNINLIFNVLGITNVINVIQREKAINKNHPKKPFLHLYYIGVFPDCQGRGVGTSLIKEVLDSYTGYEIIYLETSDQRNLKFYKRLGFEVVNVHDELEITLYILKKTR